jgi:segregation and condensation protein B
MSRLPPASDPEPQQGISLEALADAFAQVMGKTPRVQKEQDADTDDDLTADEAEQQSENAVEPSEISSFASESEAGEPGEVKQNLRLKESLAALGVEEDACPISPQTIFEAMLFVGNRENRPLTAAKAAELMRDVSPEEIPTLVEELNAGYERENCPYQIISEGEGYRLTLRKAFYPLRNKLYGRIREARLSQAAIDVLALVAYKQPLTGEQVNKMRGKPSSHILAQLVRRGLLRLRRPDEKPRTPHYSTTERFMRLFSLDSLDDLPRSEEPG